MSVYEWSMSPRALSRHDTEFFLGAGDLSYCYSCVNKKTGEISYETESPDETAFVIAARQLGFQFFERTQSRITLHELDHQSGKMVDRETVMEEHMKLNTIVTIWERLGMCK